MYTSVSALCRVSQYHSIAVSYCTYVGIRCTQLLSLGRVNDRKHKQKIQDSSTVMLIIHKFTFLLKYKRAGRKSSSSPVVIN